MCSKYYAPKACDGGVYLTDNATIGIEQKKSSKYSSSMDDLMYGNGFIGDLDWTDIDNIPEVHVFEGHLTCASSDNHRGKIKDYDALVIDKRTKKRFGLRVHLCEACGKYYTSWSLLKSIYKRKLFPQLHFIADNKLVDGFKDYSILSINGYNVRQGELTKNSDETFYNIL